MGSFYNTPLFHIWFDLMISSSTTLLKRRAADNVTPVVVCMHAYGKMPNNKYIMYKRY